MLIWKFKYILVITKVTIKLKARHKLNLKKKIVKTFIFFPVKMTMTTTPWEFVENKFIEHFFHLIVEVIL